MIVPGFPPTLKSLFQGGITRKKPNIGPTGIITLVEVGK
jgi:hypothetical protein